MYKRLIAVVGLVIAAVSWQVLGYLCIAQVRVPYPSPLVSGMKLLFTLTTPIAGLIGLLTGLAVGAQMDREWNRNARNDNQ
jgi:hypothetical protein